MKLLWLVAAAVVVGSPSFAQTQDSEKSCSKKDLSKAPGLGEPLNRDGVGWCYSFSAADLISYKIKKRVSAFDVSTQFHSSISSSWFMSFFYPKAGHMAEVGGNVDEALAAASGKALCSEADLPSDYNNNDLYNYFLNIESLKAADIEDPKCVGIKKVFPLLLAQEMKDIVGKYKGEKRLMELAKANCKNRIPIPELKFKTEPIKGVKDLAGIDKLLDSENIVSVTQDMGFYLTGPDTIVRKGKKRDTHSVTVVGREFNKRTGQCEYKIKGSSGRMKNYGYAYPYKENNKGGYVWVDRETLAKFSESYTYVE